MESESHLIWILWAAIALLVIVMHRVNHWQRRKIRFHYLRDRCPIDFPVLYEAHFAEHHALIEIVQPIWNQVANILKVDPLFLRPGDRLDVFKSHYFTHNIYDELEDLLNHRFPAGKREGILEFLTVEDFLVFMAKNIVKDEP